MKIFVMGATGATGRHFVKQLLERGIEVTAVVRSRDKLLNILGTNECPDGMEIIEGEVLTMDSKELSELIAGCDGAASCLGHNLTLKGIYGSPRYLVTDSARRVCRAVLDRKEAEAGPFKFILMNTSGNRNPDEAERRNVGEILLTALIRALLPPHRDNENAAEYLRTEVGPSNPKLEWAAVRPDTLIDEDLPSGYSLHRSPVRSPLFNPGKTSRVNVAHLMAELAADEQAWNRWNSRMPIIYNKE